MLYHVQKQNGSCGNPGSFRIIWMWVLVGYIPPINALALMFSGTLGVQILFFAMWFDMEYNKDFKKDINL